MKSIHQKVEVESKILLGRVKIVKHDNRLKEDSWKLDLGDPKCSLFKHFI